MGGQMRVVVRSSRDREALSARDHPHSPHTAGTRAPQMNAPFFEKPEKDKKLLS